MVMELYLHESPKIVLIGLNFPPLIVKTVKSPYCPSYTQATITSPLFLFLADNKVGVLETLLL
jgi:hypothetical protein